MPGGNSWYTARIYWISVVMCWCKVFTLDWCTPEMSSPLMNVLLTWRTQPSLVWSTRFDVLFTYTQIKAWYFTLNPIFTQLHSVFIHKACSHCLFFIFQGKFGAFLFWIFVPFFSKTPCPESTVYLSQLYAFHQFCFGSCATHMDSEFFSIS